MGFMDIFHISDIKNENAKLKEDIEKLKISNNDLLTENTKLKIDAATLGVTEYYQTKEKIDLMNKSLDRKIAETDSQITDKMKAAETKMRLQSERDNKIRQSSQQRNRQRLLNIWPWRDGKPVICWMVLRVS